jgi:hypothetical protein
VNVTPGNYQVTAGDVLFALTGLAVALALAWISADLLSGGRLTAAISSGGGAGLRVVADGGKDETGCEGCG